MLKIGDLTIYQEHGICQVKDISEKTYADVTRDYYVLQPINNSNEITFNIPVGNHKKLLSELMNKDEAEEILDSFHSDGAKWIQRPQQRNNQYGRTLTSGNRMDIAKVANTLISRKYKAEKDGKNFADNDRKLLENIEGILFKEMAIAFDTSLQAVKKEVSSMIHAKMG